MVDPAETTSTNMTLRWKAPSDTGGCDIVSYSLYRNNGDGGEISYEISEVRNRPTFFLN